MPQWSSDLFVFMCCGRQYVSLALPPGVVLQSVRQFRASGPRQPVDWPHPTPVADVAQWISDRKSEGFRFSP